LYLRLNSCFAMLADVLKARGAAEEFWRNMTIASALVGWRPLAAL
jgi:hypothetical protein